DFVEAYLGQNRSSAEEVEALVWLTENVIGAANKRQAGGWLKAVVGSLRFETEMTESRESPGAVLGRLADLHRAVGRCGLVPEDYEPIQERLGEVGGAVEARARVAQSL